VPQYCTVAEVGTRGIAAAALEGVDPSELQAAISAASSTIDGYLRPKFTLPLVTWEDDISECCAILAGYAALSTRGYSPEGDPAVKQRYDEKIAWLRDIAKGLVSPSVTDSAPNAEPGLPSSGPRVISQTSRGYSPRGKGRVGSGPFTGDS